MLVSNGVRYRKVPLYYLVSLTSYLVLIVTAGEVFERSYLGNVTGMQLNGFYAAALFEGKIQLHQVCCGLDVCTTAGTCIYIHVHTYGMHL